MRTIKIISVFGLLGLVSGLVTYYLLTSFSFQADNDFLYGSYFNLIFIPFIFSFFMSVAFYLLFPKMMEDKQYKKGLIYFNLCTVFGYFLSVYFYILYANIDLLSAGPIDQKFLPGVIFTGGIFIVLGLYKFLRHLSSFISLLLIGGSGVLGFLLIATDLSSYEKSYTFFIFWQVYVAVMMGFIINEWDKNKKISSNLNQNG